MIRRIAGSFIRPLRVDQSVPEARVPPVKDIIDVECDAFGIEGGEREELWELYKDYAWETRRAVSRKAERLRRSSPLGRVVRPREHRERAMLHSMSEVFHQDPRVSYERRALLVDLIRDRKYNCYAATVFFTDVLGMMGQPVAVVMEDGHIRPAGSRYVLETIRPFAPPRPVSAHEASDHWEDDIGKLLAVAYNWGMVVSNERRGAEEALRFCDSALAIDPANAAIWANRGLLLMEMPGMRDESISSFRRSLAIEPENAKVMTDLGVAYYRFGRRGDSLAALFDAMRADPEYQRAHEVKESLFDRRHGRNRQEPGSRARLKD